MVATCVLFRRAWLQRLPRSETSPGMDFVALCETAITSNRRIDAIGRREMSGLRNGGTADTAVDTRC